MIYPDGLKPSFRFLDKCSLTNYAFTGQSRDDVTNLQYHRARWLDTSLGQWTSTDPVFDFPLNFGSQYGYVGGSPIKLYDSSGMSTMQDLSITGMIRAQLSGIVFNVMPAIKATVLWQSFRFSTTAFAINSMFQGFSLFYTGKLIPRLMHELQILSDNVSELSANFAYHIDGLIAALYENYKKIIGWAMITPVIAFANPFAAWLVLAWRVKELTEVILDVQSLLGTSKNHDLV